MGVEIGAAVAGGLASGVAGSALGGMFGGDEEGGQMAPAFLPYSLTTGYGSSKAKLDPLTGEVKMSSKLNEELDRLRNLGYGGSEELLPLALSESQRNIPQFDFTYDPQQAMQEYYNTGLGLLEPQMVQQAQMAGERMFGSGRTGLRLSGDALGAGTGHGLLSPDAYNTNLAQSRALAELYATSRDKALAEEAQRYNVLSGVYGIDRAAQQQYLTNLMGGMEGLFGIGQGLSELENSMNTIGLGIGTSGMMQTPAAPESLNSKLMGGALGGITKGIGSGVSNWVSGLGRSSVPAGGATRFGSFDSSFNF